MAAGSVGEGLKSNASESVLLRGNEKSAQLLFRSLTSAGRSPISRVGLSLLIVPFVILLLSGCDIGGERFSPSTPTRVQPTSTVPSATGTDTPPASGGMATAAPDSTAAPTATGVVLPVVYSRGSSGPAGVRPRHMATLDG